MQTLPQILPGPEYAPGYEGHLCVVSLRWEEKRRGCGPGPAGLVSPGSGAEFRVVWKSCSRSENKCEGRMIEPCYLTGY